MLRPGTQDTLISRRENMPTAKSHAELVREVEPRIKAQAFFSARVSEAHILDRLREVSDGYSRGEFGFGEARNKLKDFLRAEGYDPHQGGMRNLASTGRLNLILKQNAAMAHAAAEWKRMHDPDAMKVYPYVRYHARSDSRTRSEHSQLDGRIFRKDDPYLSTHTPPWEFNCRCWLEEITEKEAGKTPDLIQVPTPADKVTVDSKSGFSFDPAHAFEKFDFDAIKDPGLRENAREGVEKILAGKVPDQPAKPAEPVGIEGNYTDGERKSIRYAVDKIGDAKREHLLVFDSQGKLEYQETGTKHHAGYATENISYEGKIVVHNHPKGNFPFFSQQDLDTFHSKHIQTAAVVSGDYVVTIQRDEEYKHEPMKIDITNGRDFRNMNIRTEISDLYRQLRRAKTESEFHDLRDRYIQLNLQYQTDMASEAGYKISWCKREDAERLLAGKTEQADEKLSYRDKPEEFLKEKAEELKRRVAAESSRKIFPKNPKEFLKGEALDKAETEARKAVLPEVMDAVDQKIREIGEDAVEPFLHYSSRPGDSENVSVRQAAFKDGKLDWTGVKVSEERKQAVADLQNLLEIMPKFKGTVYRGCTFDTAENLDAYLQKLFGEPESLMGFISTTPDPVIAHYYASSGKFKVVVVVPNSQNSVYFGPHSKHPEDEEALISYKFYLKGLKKYEENGILYVLAEEVPR